MAIASIRTFLSLDRYAQILGINPVFFAGSSDIELSDGRVLFPLSNAQNDLWPQYSWQNFDQVSREELARQIHIAELAIIDYLGFNPYPNWVENERHDLGWHYRSELQYRPMRYDAAGNEGQITTGLSQFISGGRRAVSLIESPLVVYSDPDADGWDELATITVNIAAGTDPLEVKLYFYGNDGDQIFEIREPRTKVATAATVTFTYNTWQLVDPEIYERLPSSDTELIGVDLNDPSVLVAQVDAYREYNDTTENHVVFYSNNRTDGSISEQGGFIYRIQDDNFITPVQADYDATSGAWVRSTTQCVYPDYMNLWYYSGMKDFRRQIKTTEDYMPQDIAVAIAYMATARLERAFYSNNNATALAADLREDHLQTDRTQYKAAPPDAFTNPFGSRVGELRAWRLVQRFHTATRSGGSL